MLESMLARRVIATALLCCSLGVRASEVPATRPANAPAEGKLPHLQIDAKHQQVRMECEAVNAEMALEFLVVVAGTAEHEAVLRSRAKPSHLHLALLMLGLEPGEPARMGDDGRRQAPSGPALKLSCRFEKDGRTITVPAHRLMRDRKSRREMPAIHWVFTGSRVMRDGQYAADVTGYLVSVVNFEFTPIDVPQIKSSSNDALEWEINTDIAPKRDAKVWLIIEPAETPKE